MRTVNRVGRSPARHQLLHRIPVVQLFHEGRILLFLIGHRFPLAAVDTHFNPVALFTHKKVGVDTSRRIASSGYYFWVKEIDLIFFFASGYLVVYAISVIAYV